MVWLEMKQKHWVSNGMVWLGINFKPMGKYGMVRLGMKKPLDKMWYGKIRNEEVTR